MTIRTFNVLRQLQKEFDVTVLMFSRRNHQANGSSREAGRRALRELGLDALEALPIASEYSSARTAWDHLRSVATARAYTFYQYQSRAFRRQLRDVLSRKRFTLVHVDSIDLHGAALCPAFAANLVMSEIDQQRLLQLAPGARVAVVPNGVDTAFFMPPGNRARPSGRIVFAGHTFVEANRDAVDFFLGDIWPLVRERRPSATVHLIGRSAEPDRERFCSHAGVTAHGYVPDIRPHLAHADCAVVPIRFGGGTRIKILDAWPMGPAVVSTSVGCEGLRTLDGENILVRDSPEAFAEAVAQVLADSDLRAHLGKGGRRTVEELYSWDIIGSRMRELYRRIA